jgi:hypothetical protein
MVAVTETSAAAQALAATGPERPQHPVQRPSTASSPANGAVTPATTEAARAEATPAPSPIGFTLHYDNDLQRLILEARDPVSGYVIVQIPPKYVVKQFSATVRATLDATRGTGVNAAV